MIIYVMAACDYIAYSSFRLYQRELRKASHASSWLGVGVAVFQGLSNLAINSVILVVVGHGGLLLASNQVSPGNLMAFLVATQTIQRSELVVWAGGEALTCPPPSPDHLLACQSCLGRWSGG